MSCEQVPKYERNFGTFLQHYTALCSEIHSRFHENFELQTETKTQLGESDDLTREAHNTEVCSRNHCCCAKARCISYSVGGCVALVFKKESTCVILYYRLWLVRVYEIFPHNLIKGTIFGKTGVICSIKKIVFFLFSLKILSGIFMILPRIQ